jgi:hydroxypyruvate isomerase
VSVLPIAGVTEDDTNKPGACGRDAVEEERVRFTVNCSILLTELPLLERPAAARAAGFDAVELWWPFDGADPEARDIRALEDALHEQDLQLTGINLHSGDRAAGERGLLSLPGRRAELQVNLDVVTGIGERTGCRAFNALYGSRLPMPADEQDALAVDNLVLAAAAVDRIDGVVLVEPRSGADGYALRSSRHALDLLAQARARGAHNVRLLADLYHLAELGEQVPEVLAEHAPEIGHVQIADSPGRGAPGTGQLDLSGWLELCGRLGYDGYVGLEYAAPAASAFDWLPRSSRGFGSDPP